jgi:hypothetical protein
LKPSDIINRQVEEGRGRGRGGEGRRRRVNDDVT